MSLLICADCGALRKTGRTVTSFAQKENGDQALWSPFPRYGVERFSSVYLLYLDVIARVNFLRDARDDDSRRALLNADDDRFADNFARQLRTIVLNVRR